jgi:hypothetical protein
MAHELNSTQAQFISLGDMLENESAGQAIRVDAIKASFRYGIAEFDSVVYLMNGVLYAYHWKGIRMTRKDQFPVNLTMFDSRGEGEAEYHLGIAMAEFVAYAMKACAGYEF